MENNIQIDVDNIFTMNDHFNHTVFTVEGFPDKSLLIDVENSDGKKLSVCFYPSDFKKLKKYINSLK